MLSAGLSPLGSVRNHIFTSASVFLACKQPVFEQRRWSVHDFPWSGLSRLITLLLPRGSCHLLFLCSSFTWRVQVVLCSLHLPLSPKRLITQHSCLAHNHAVSMLMTQHSNAVDRRQLLFCSRITFKHDAALLWLQTGWIWSLIWILHNPSLNRLSF